MTSLISTVGIRYDDFGTPAKLKKTAEAAKKTEKAFNQLGVAKELGYTLQELNQKITQEELVMWSVYFDLLNDEQEKNNRRAKYR